MRLASWLWRRFSAEILDAAFADPDARPIGTLAAARSGALARSAPREETERA